MKTCNKCKQEQPLEAFSKNVYGPDGLQCYCRACNRRYRLENHKSVSAGQKRYRLEKQEEIRLWKKRYYSENRERLLAEKKQYYLENKEAILVDKKQYHLENREAVIARRRHSKYGITPEQYRAMQASQNNCCACCGDVFSKEPNIDHNHVTGVVRALLCVGCNTGLGNFKDCSSRCLAAAKYLKKFGGRPA